MREQRGRLPEVPFGYEALLTHQQRHQIDLCRSVGWILQFIRRPQFQQPTVVMLDSGPGKSWQILDNGCLKLFQNLRSNEQPISLDEQFYSGLF